MEISTDPQIGSFLKLLSPNLGTEGGIVDICRTQNILVSPAIYTSLVFMQLSNLTLKKNINNSEEQSVFNGKEPKGEGDIVTLLYLQYYKVNSFYKNWRIGFIFY